LPTGSSGDKGWKIVEEPSYELATAQGGGHEFFDDVTELLHYALHRNPTGFPQVPGYQGIYLAKTKLRIRLPEVIPSYRLWFRLDEATHTVHKLWIEIAPPEDMEYWADEDDDTL
jgi:hypothetical protein